MNIDLRFPNITETTADGKVNQLTSYLHQLVQQLNWGLNTLNDAVAGNASSVVVNNKQGEDITPEEALDTFNSIKALIIKSADIVEAYEETIKTNLSGEYVATSEFGEYTEKTNATITENSTRLEAVYTSVQTIGDDVKTTNAYIKRGLLGEYQDGDLKGQQAYGIGVGETTDGEYKSYAWFTANRLSFFDGNSEVAYINSKKLYITSAAFTGSIQIGKYKIDTTDGLAFLWIGG